MEASACRDSPESREAVAADATAGTLEDTYKVVDPPIVEIADVMLVLRDETQFKHAV